MAKKRLFEDLSKIDEVTGVADVQFGIETLSPVKKSKKGSDYYDGIASDGTRSVRLVGTRSVRLVGFDVKTQEAIDTYYKKGESVLLRNCNFKKGQNSETEILVNQSTKIEQR